MALTASELWKLLSLDPGRGRSIIVVTSQFLSQLWMLSADGDKTQTNCCQNRPLNYPSPDPGQSSAGLGKITPKLSSKKAGSEHNIIETYLSEQGDLYDFIWDWEALKTLKLFSLWGKINTIKSDNVHSKLQCFVTTKCQRFFLSIILLYRIIFFRIVALIHCNNNQWDESKIFRVGSNYMSPVVEVIM